MLVERLRVELEARLDLEHDLILLELGEVLCDLPLAEGVVQRVVDHLRAMPKRAAGVAVDLER